MAGDSRTLIDGMVVDAMFSNGRVWHKQSWRKRTLRV
jgi:hypothetical protein